MFWLPVDSPHKRPLILCLKVFFVVSLSKLLKQQSICWCWKTSSCVILNIFSLRFKVLQQILKFLREINYDNNLINFSLRRYVLSSGKIFQDVIISVFTINVCTQLIYNGQGGTNWLVLISPPHNPCDLFWLCPEDRFTATEVFHQHANTDVPVKSKMIYHSNNSNAYNQVTQITHLNFNWGMLGIYLPICYPNNFTLDLCETLEWPVGRSVIWHLLTQDVLGRCQKRYELLERKLILAWVSRCQNIYITIAQVFFIFAPWFYAYMTESIHMWHIYKPWGDNLSCPISR